MSEAAYAISAIPVAGASSGTDPEERLSPVERWKEEIKQAEDELKDFHNRGRKVTRRFLDERDLLEQNNKWFNIYYANTIIMESALYAQLPKPSVSRKFKDYEDDVARVAALILQRSITQDLDDPRDNFDSMMRSCVQDRLIPGMAMAWLRLETDVEDVPGEPANEPDYGLMPSPEPGTDLQEVGAGVGTREDSPENNHPLQRITDQRVCVDYIYWQDFLFSPCRVWEERRWVGRIVYMDRPALIKRFGEKKGKVIPLDWSPTHAGKMTPSMEPKYDAVKKARIYEIWERGTRKVFWISKSYPEILDTRDDPLQLIGFEPCPKPMLANVTTSNCTPRPDYYMIQDQYQELDVLNNRISMLLQACKVVGVYDKAAEGISRMLTEGFDNQLIPVDNWAMFAEKGGIKGNLDWLPLDAVVTSLTQLIQSRELIKQQIYELTGISDIVRGATKASETLGAQEIKSRFASIAIKKRQDEVARFAAEVLRIKAEIQVKHFDPQVLIVKSNIMATGIANQQYVPAALEMLMSDEGFEWRIEVTADSIAQADYAMEKADRIELLTAVSGYLEKSGGMIQAKPESAPILMNMLKWAVSGFRGANEIEGMLDQQLDAMQKQPPQPKPDPEQQKLQAEMQRDQQKAALDAQAQQQKLQMDMQAKQAEMAMKEKMNQMELQMKQMEFNFKVKELELKERQMTMEMRFDEAEAARNERTALMESQMNLQAKSQEHEMNKEFASQDHAMKMEQSEAVGQQKVAQAKQAAAAKPKASKE